MVNKTLLAVTAAGILMMAASALAPGSQTPPAVSNDESGYGHHISRHTKGRLLEDCLAEPLACSLVVW